MLTRSLVVVVASAACSTPPASTPSPSPPTPRSPVDAPAVVLADAPPAPPTVDAPARPVLAGADCKALVSAPAIAIATVASSTADCSGIGNKHIVFDVVRLVRGTAITRVVTSRRLYGAERETFAVGDTFVVAIEPGARPARTVQCVAIPAHEGTARHLVRASSAADAEHLVDAIAACREPAARAATRRGIARRSCRALHGPRTAFATSDTAVREGAGMWLECRLLVSSRMRNALVIGVLACACVADDAADDWSDPGKSDDPTSGGLVATHAPEVRVLDGFHALLDTTSGQCLEPTGSGPSFSIGAIEKLFELRFVKEKEDLAQTLGIDVGLKIKYGAASGAATASFLDSFKQTGTATHLLASARASYRVTNRRPVKLTGEAGELLTSDPRAFLHRCGNFYVNGVEHEAQLFVMIRLDAQTEDAARSITADLGLQGGTTALGVDASVKGKLEQLAKREDITVEVSVLDRGFLTDGGTTGLISSLLTGGLDAMTFDKIDGVRRAMLDSLNADACRDGGMGLATCAGERPGYAENTVRNAVPVRIDLRPYARATNAPIGGAGSPYEVMRKLVDVANQHLRALSRNATRMDAIVNDEIAPFLAAPTARKASYGIASPAAPVFTVDALVATATRFRDTFDADRAGSPAAALHDEIARCWASALEGAIDTCATPDGIDALPQTKATDAALADYTASGRIVPLRFSIEGVLRFEDAEAACASKARRLPTFDEAQRLAVTIGFADLPRTTETRLRFAAWHADRAMCSAGQFGTFSNVPGGAHGNLCTSDSLLSQHPATTLCVPPGGPFEN